MGEFELIERIRSRFSCPEGIVGIGDDCAVLPQEAGRESLVSTDMLVDGTHFLLDDITAYQLGWKSAAVNLSDIAAMGGRPDGTFLSLALTRAITSDWIDDFISGYKALSDTFGCPLLGGDTVLTAGPLCISVTVLGSCIRKRSRQRSGALAGDDIYVSGCLGDSAAGLKCIFMRREGAELPEFCAELIERHYLPLPRIELASRLAADPEVHAMMDISDGLASDLPHILHASGTGATVDLSLLPLSPAFSSFCSKYESDPFELAICGGEDYQLLFTAGPSFDPSGLDVTRIGSITADGALVWQGGKCKYNGFRHF